MYLLDTNVLSELRKYSARRADPRVIAWAENTDSRSHFLSVITILEIETGILRLERRDKDQATQLRDWLESIVVPDFDGRILEVDIKIAREAAGLQVPKSRPVSDTLIAATALARGLTLVTRNVSDFVGIGFRILNPWTD